MTTFQHKLTTLSTKDGEWDGEHFYYCESNGIKFQLSTVGCWVAFVHLKNSINDACHTATRDGLQYVNSPNFRELMYVKPEYFKQIGTEVWVKIDILFDLLPRCFKRFAAYTCWNLGERDWTSHLFEFIYIRCDPKFKLIDFIIKGGREMNPTGRESNYWQHAIDDGCGTIFCLFVVRYGSPAEKLLKKILLKHFYQAPKKVHGKKAGTEYFTVPDVDSLENLTDKVIEAGSEFATEMSYTDELIDEWYLGDKMTPEHFILKYMPWLKLPNHKLGEK